MYQPVTDANTALSEKWYSDIPAFHLLSQRVDRSYCHKHLLPGKQKSRPYDYFRHSTDFNWDARQKMFDS